MTILIIGLGAIGGSFAMGLHAAGYSSIYGVDIDKETVQIALDKGYIQKGSTEPDTFLAEADIVLLSLYPDQIIPFVKKYSTHFKSGTVLTDVTGVKTSLIKDIQDFLREDVDFIFAHPMRGSEKKGFSGADYTRFIGANALVTPAPFNKEPNLQKIEQLYRDVGFQTITRVSPEQHDEQIAYVSQLMHALAVSVVNSSQASDETLTFAGNSFQELTRIADINDELWSQLFLHNREALLKSINLFEKELDILKRSLADNDEHTLRDLFVSSRTQRKKWF